MLKKENRIRLKKEFDQVFKRGFSLYNKMVGLKVINNDLEVSRLGIIVSTKVSKRAVRRNQIKRVVRNFFDSNKQRIATGKDIVIITLPEIDKKDKNEIEEVLIETFKSMNLFID